MRLPLPYVAKALLYLALLGGILLALKTQDSYADITPYWRKLQDAKQVQPRTLFLGSSRTMRHVDPVRLDSLQGTGETSYNFGVPGSRYLETHFRADLLLDMEIPSVERMVIEFGPISPEVSDKVASTRRSQHYHDWRRARIGAAAALATDQPLAERIPAAADRWRFWTLNTFLVGWGRAWTNAVVTDKAGTEKRKAVGRRGFVGLRGIDNKTLQGRRDDFVSAEGQTEFARRVTSIRQRQSAVPTARDTVSANAWTDLAERARARGIEVVYVEQVGTEGAAGVTALLRQRLGEDAVIVLNDPERYPEFYDAAAWFDVAHLRQRFALRATDVLAERLPPLPPR